MTKTTMPQNIIKPFAVAQAVVLLTLFVSSAAFANAETAFLSAFFILIGSMYSYSRLVRRNLENDTPIHHDDIVDKIDDPYDLYGEEELPEEERSLKEVIKEEKAKLKANGAAVKKVAKSSPALVSLYRLIPYGFLVLGFIGLKNNQMFLPIYYLPGLAAGIVTGYLSGKAAFIRHPK